MSLLSSSCFYKFPGLLLVVSCFCSLYKYVFECVSMSSSICIKIFGLYEGWLTVYLVFVVIVNRWWAPLKFDPVRSPMLFFEKGQPVIPPISPSEGLDIVLKNMVQSSIIF